MMELAMVVVVQVTTTTLRTVVLEVTVNQSHSSLPPLSKIQQTRTECESGPKRLNTKLLLLAVRMTNKVSVQRTYLKALN